LRLDKEYDKLEATKQKSKEKVQLTERQKEWDSSIYKAMEKFAELKNEDGTLNQESTLWKEAVKLMTTNAKKPNHHKFLDAINPSYDHADGPYVAIVEMFLKQSDSKSTKKVQQVKKENNQLKAKEQLLTQSMNHADTTNASDKLRSKALESVIEHGENTNDSLEFLRLENKRIGLTK
jgi:hypothetical protein